MNNSAGRLKKRSIDIEQFAKGRLRAAFGFFFDYGYTTTASALNTIILLQSHIGNASATAAQSTISTASIPCSTIFSKSK